MNSAMRESLRKDKNKGPCKQKLYNYKEILAYLKELIHGAIIAREYGVPCVTGIPGATDYIKTGFSVTVDGHLGIVTLDTSDNKSR